MQKNLIGIYTKRSSSDFIFFLISVFKMIGREQSRLQHDTPSFGFSKVRKMVYQMQLWYSNFFKNSASYIVDLYILTSHLQQHISYHVFQTPFPYLYFVCSAKKVRKSNITIPNLEIYNSILSLTSKWGILQERKKEFYFHLT